MFRKSLLALAAVAALATAALAPTSASAWHGGWHGHHHWHKHHVYFRPVHYGCWRKVWVDTPYGGFFKRINVCY